MSKQKRNYFKENKSNPIQFNTKSELSLTEMTK